MINDRGQVVGTTRGLEAFVWQSGTLTGLGALPGRPYSTPVAINELGQVIGNSSTRRDGSGSRAFLWWKGRMTAIRPLTAKSSYAVAINDRGQVVGTSGNRAFVWQGGKTTWLGVLPGQSWTSVAAINERGQVVGTSGNRAFVWEGGKLIDLGVLRGRNASFPTSINTNGQIVGWSSRIGSDGASSMAHAFVWEERAHGRPLEPSRPRSRASPWRSTTVGWSPVTPAAAPSSGHVAAVDRSVARGHARQTARPMRCVVVGQLGWGAFMS